MTAKAKRISSKKDKSAGLSLRISQKMNGHCVLAMGGEFKNTIALAFDGKVFVSPVSGDLESPEAYHIFEKNVERFPLLHGKTPDIIAVDLHPALHSTLLGEKIASEKNIPLIRVQHHYAHALSCMAEHGLKKSLALVFDGTGLGTDGSIWGAELLSIDDSGFTRLASFAAVPLPGGDAAVREPSRQLIARLHHAGIPIDENICKTFKIDYAKAGIWIEQCRKKLNSPSSHSAGRLFDSFSCLLGFSPDKITYEGEPAIRLENEARSFRGKKYSFPGKPFKLVEKENLLLIDWSPLFSDWKSFTGISREVEAGSAFGFHDSVKKAAIEMAVFGKSKIPSRNIVLSGGVFQNKLLCSLLIPELEKLGLKVFTHEISSPNDSGISIGQAIAGLRMAF